MDFDELKPLLLPSAIGDCISSRTDSDGALPMNLSSQLIDKISNDPVRAERLVAQAESIWDHLASGTSGWDNGRPASRIHFLSVFFWAFGFSEELRS